MTIGAGSSVQRASFHEMLKSITPVTTSTTICASSPWMAWRTKSFMASVS